jgi:hypothetical protein
MMHARLLMAIGACAVVAACGGGGGSTTTTPTTHPVTTTRKPDASIKITIVPSNVIHGGHRSTPSKKRKPQFVDPYGTSVSLQFSPYNFSNNGQPSAPQTYSGPIPIATYGPTTATVPVYSGFIQVYGTEIYGAQAGAGVSAVLASNQQFYNTYTIDPGTTESIALTLSLVPAQIMLTTDPTLASGANEVNGACLNVGNQNPTQLFTLVPADANYDYLPIAPASLQTPPPNGLNGTVTLTGITGSSDNGGSSTIVPTNTTWNGYTVYEFIYTPTGNGEFYAPPVTATANTFNPDGGYDYLDQISDPPGNSGSAYSEQVTINPQNCDD